MSKTQMFDPSTFSEGGGFSLAGIEGVVVSSLFKWTNWAKKDGSIPTYKSGRNKGQPVKPATIWEIAVKTDDRDDPVVGTISASGVLVPSKDAVLPAKDREGPFLVHPDGKDASINTQTGAAALITSLVNASFDFQLFNEQGSVALEGYRLAFEEIEKKDSKTGQPIVKDDGTKVVQTIVSKIVHGPGRSSKAKGGKAPVVGTSTVKKVVGKPASVQEPEPQEPGEEFDAEGTVTEAIQAILAETSPLPKAKVSMAVNKVLAGMGLENTDRLAALKLATDDEFLSAGPWNYDKKSLSAL